MKFSVVIIFITSLLFLNYNILAKNDTSQKIGSFGPWQVYSKSKHLCYMISEPKISEGKYAFRGNVRAIVYRNSEKKEYKNIVGFEFGYPFSTNETVTVEIDNKKTFELSTFGQTAWTGSKAISNRKLIKEMIKGNKLIVSGRSQKGTYTKDTYSLRGFSKAFKEIIKYCG